MQGRDLVLEKPGAVLGKLKKWVDFSASRLRLEPRRPTPARMVSVIIPAHNEAAYIRGTLEALRRQNYGWMEVIVVANGCTDGTPEVAKGRCDRLITVSRKSLGVARNLGARMARGDILVFLDADTLLEPMAIRRVAEDFSEEHAAGTVRGVPDSPRLPYRAVYWCKNAVHRLRLHAGSSGVILCWRTHFMCVGGFDEDLQVRENSHLMKRLLRFGKYQYVGDVAAMTSMRRFERRGFSKVAWLWIKVWVQSVFGDLRQRQYEIVR